MTRSPRAKRLPGARFVLLGALLAGAGAGTAGPADAPFAGDVPPAKGLPRLVFVRAYGAFHVRGGRADTVRFGPDVRRALFVREKDGRVHPLLREPMFHDVAHPVASWDAGRIAFAAQAGADSAWRIWTVGADGTRLTQVTRTDRALGDGSDGPAGPAGPFGGPRFARYDDDDPAWLPDGRIVFASTRFPQVAQRGGTLVPNLFAVRADGSRLERLTTERNGAERPAVDPASGRLLYARWFFSPYLAEGGTGTGLTLDPARAAPHEAVDLWQAISAFPDGDRIQLAAGDPRAHDSCGCYAPCPLAGGAVAGLLGALPPSRTGRALVVYPGGAGPGRVLVRAPAIEAPAALPDGRVAFAMRRPGAGSDALSLYVVSPRDGRLERVETGGAGADETDPCPLVARPRPPILPAQGGIDDPPSALPAATREQVTRLDDTFRFDCLNVFASGPVDSPTPSAPRIARGARIRFFATLARPGAATGDTAVLVREVPLTPAGAVHESDMPADVPLFEELVDQAGHVLMAAHGPALVPGANFARVGAGTKCVGCHAGHSTLVVPRNYTDARWFNASPSAEVTASAVRAGAAPASALVDRVARGPVERTGWVADGPGPQSARLAWPAPIEAREFVLYAPSTDRGAGTDVRIGSCALVFTLHGREVGRAQARDVRPAGTRVPIPPTVLDAVEIVPAATGHVAGRPAVALAEIETIARLPE